MSSEDNDPFERLIEKFKSVSIDLSAAIEKLEYRAKLEEAGEDAATIEGKIHENTTSFIALKPMTVLAKDEDELKELNALPSEVRHIVELMKNLEG